MQRERERERDARRPFCSAAEGRRGIVDQWNIRRILSHKSLAFWQGGPPHSEGGPPHSDQFEHYTLENHDTVQYNLIIHKSLSLAFYQHRIQPRHFIFEGLDTSKSIAQNIEYGFGVKNSFWMRLWVHDFYVVCARAYVLFFAKCKHETHILLIDRSHAISVRIVRSRLDRGTFAR